MTSDQDSLATKVQSSYQRLSVVASDLNKVSDELGKSVAELDAALKKLNLGITAWIDIHSNDDPQTATHWSEELGYAKVAGKWGIALRTISGDYNWPDQDDVEIWLFNDAPRALRLSAIGLIPALLEELSVQAVDNTEKIKAKLADAQEVAKVVRASADNVKRSASKGEQKK